MRKLWARGVHRAPWRVLYGLTLTDVDCEVHIGGALVAVDARHRLVAEMVVPDAADEPAVQRSLEAILETVEESAGEGSEDGISTDGYVDPYDDGNPDDHWCGEDWKRDR
jgi:hypothetical protein